MEDEGKTGDSISTLIFQFYLDENPGVWIGNLESQYLKYILSSSYVELSVERTITTMTYLSHAQSMHII
jgi:hypothetical protein